MCITSINVDAGCICAVNKVKREQSTSTLGRNLINPCNSSASRGARTNERKSPHGCVNNVSLNCTGSSAPLCENICNQQGKQIARTRTSPLLVGLVHNLAPRHKRTKSAHAKPNRHAEIYTILFGPLVSAVAHTGASTYSLMATIETRCKKGLGACEW